MVTLRLSKARHFKFPVLKPGASGCVCICAWESKLCPSSIVSAELYRKSTWKDTRLSRSFFSEKKKKNLNRSLIVRGKIKDKIKHKKLCIHFKWERTSLNLQHLFRWVCCRWAGIAVNEPAACCSQGQAGGVSWWRDRTCKPAAVHWHAPGRKMWFVTQQLGNNNENIIAPGGWLAVFQLLSYYTSWEELWFSVFVSLGQPEAHPSGIFLPSLLNVSLNPGEELHPQQPGKILPLL